MYELGGELPAVTVETGTNLLVTGPPLVGKRRLALETLARGATENESAVIVTVRERGQRLLDDYRSLAGQRASDRVGVVDAVTSHVGQQVPGTDRIVPVEAPDETTALGSEFSELVEEFYANGGPERSRVMFDSLTTLLQYSNVRTVYRFLHEFTSRVENTDAVGLYTLESTAHDQATRETIRGAFDGVIEVREAHATVDVPGTPQQRLDR